MQHIIIPFETKAWLLTPASPYKCLRSPQCSHSWERFQALCIVLSLWLHWRSVHDLVRGLGNFNSLNPKHQRKLNIHWKPDQIGAPWHLGVSKAPEIFVQQLCPQLFRMGKHYLGNGSLLMKLSVQTFLRISRLHPLHSQTCYETQTCNWCQSLLANVCPWKWKAVHLHP